MCFGFFCFFCFSHWFTSPIWLKFIKILKFENSKYFSRFFSLINRIEWEEKVNRLINIQSNYWWALVEKKNILCINLFFISWKMVEIKRSEKNELIEKWGWNLNLEKKWQTNESIKRDKYIEKKNNFKSLSICTVLMP